MVMDLDLLYRTIPFLSLALILAGWALIELLQTPRRDWDGLTWTISAAGLGGALYLGSLALNYAPVGITIRSGVFEAIRIVLILTVPGVPIVWVNVWRAWRARRKGIYRQKAIHDPPKEQSP
jgi:hypothetical protein